MQVFQSNCPVCVEIISVFRESSISGNYACKGISCPLCPDTNSIFLFLCIDYFICYEHRILCSLSLKMYMLGVSLCLLVIAAALLTQTDCHCTIAWHHATILWVTSDDRATVIATLCQVTRTSLGPLPAESTTRYAHLFVFTPLLCDRYPNLGTQDPVGFRSDRAGRVLIFPCGCPWLPEIQV